jgi:hypothetical protein
LHRSDGVRGHPADAGVDLVEDGLPARDGRERRRP